MFLYPKEMKMKRLRKWLEEHGYSVAADASSDDIETLAQKAIADKKLTLKQCAALASDESDEDPMDALAAKTATAVATALSGPLAAIAEAVKGAKAPEAPTPEPKDDDFDPEDNPALKAYMERLESKVDAIEKARGGDGASLIDKVLKLGIPKDDADPVSIRVKNAIERFDDTRTAMTWKKGFKKGEPMFYNGQPVNLATPRSLAMCHAWMKFQTFPEHLTEHDKDIILWALHNSKFYMPNDRDDTSARKLTAEEREACWNAHMTRGGYTKALIDDSTSGGENAVPEWFDFNVAILPILGMELVPYVNMIDVPRGSAADAFTMGNPTFAAANTEGSATNVFTTTSFIGALDTTFFRAAGFMEVGRNFLQDAAPGVAELILNRYNAKHGEWLDEQLVVGDGTTEPQGVFNANGTTDVTIASPSSSWAIGDVVEMFFGISKAYRTAFPRTQLAFAGTDTTYQRFRQIATGVTGDTRLIFSSETGDDRIDSYTLFGIPYATVATGLTNDQLAFVQWGGYRLYRRQGIRFIREDRGDTMVRQNTILLGADFRYGGQLERGGYAAVTDSGPA